MRTRTLHYVTADDDVDLGTTWPSADNDEKVFVCKDAEGFVHGYVVGYITYDDTCRDIDEMIGDCMGKLYSFHRWADKDEHLAGLEALGLDSYGERDLSLVFTRHAEAFAERYVKAVMEFYNDDYEAALERLDATPDEDQSLDTAVEELLYEDAINAHDFDHTTFDDIGMATIRSMWDDPQFFPGDKDAQVLDCYDHGWQVWSLSGGGMQCQWDTARGAGVWVPDDELRKQLDDDEADGLNRDEQARKYCKQFLESYNDVINGRVYGVVIHTYDCDGEMTDTDACWGYVGTEYAEQELETQFKHAVEAMEKQHAA